MNVVILSGRLVYEPEPKMTESGYTFLSTRIAVSRNDKNKTTDFFNLKAWNSTAKFIGQYFHKGDPIEVKGRLQTETYDGQDGTKTTNTFVLADDVSFTLRPSDKSNEEQAPTKPTEEIPMSELPFEV